MTVISIPVVLNEAHDCGYLNSQKEQSAFVHPDFELTVLMYSQLLQNGFRRSGDHVYRPLCKQCSACIPVRIPVNAFRPSRNQRRALKHKPFISVQIKPASFEQVHYDLYLKYQNARHSGGGMANSSPGDYLNFLSSQWCNTEFVEFSIQGSLVAIAVVDKLENALSAVYTFFDPDFSHYSLGTYAVLWEIEYAHRLGLSWLYMGYWIEQCQKMSYKNQYRPLEAYIKEEWRIFEKNEPVKYAGSEFK